MPRYPYRQIGVSLNKQARNDQNKNLVDIAADIAEQSGRSETINKRIDNLVLHASGDSNAEVVDARNAEDGTTFSTLRNRLDETDEKIKAMDIPHKLDYKCLSMNVGQNGSRVPQQSFWEHAKKQGMNSILFVMVGITSLTDDAPTLVDDSLITQAIQDAENNEVKIDMIKPHLGVNYSDNTNRSKYLPDDVDAFFSNWKAVLLHYAGICKNNNIPILCVGCEQPNQASDEYLDKWQDIVSSVKSSYPDLLLTYAARTDEFSAEGHTKIYSLLDFIGVNIYLSYTRKSLSEETPTISDLAKAFYLNYDGIEVIPSLEKLSNEYQKPVFITEIGCRPINDGLITNTPYNVDDSGVNYDAVYWLMKAAFDVLFRMPFISGFGWWSADDPYTYFAEGSTTSAEQIAIDYVAGGKI